MKSRPVILRLLKQRALPPRPILRPQFLANSSQPISTAIRPLSTTCRLLNETKKEDTKGKEPPKKKATVEDNAPPQSPWKVFINTLKEEIEKNQGWQDNVKQLQGDASKVVDSEAMKRARILYEKARISNMIKENPRIAAAAKTLSDTGVSMSDATARALQDAGVIAALEQLTNFGRRFTQPLKDSVVGQAIIEALDDIGMEGYEDKEVRRERRRKRLAKAGGSKKMRANPEAGEAVVLSSDSEPSTSRLSFLSQSPAYQRFKENYYESDEPLYNALRMVGSKFGRLVQENEHARVIVSTRQIDPDFRFDKFQVELKEYIVPEVIDAFLSADQPDMRSWMSEAAYNVSWAQIGEYVKRGLVSSCRVQEIGSVDIHKAMFVNDTIPVFLVACEVQEINAWKSAKTGKVMIGAEDVIQRTRYAMALTMVEAELDNELTGGWKISEFVRREM